MSNPKQIIILRKDLNMRKGKMVAQGAHASMAVFFNRILEPQGLEWNNEVAMKITEPMFQWMSGHFTKICVSVNSEQELLDLHAQAVAAKIPCSLIKDSGFTEFNGVPTYTAVAIGPDYPEAIDPLTKHLPLL